METDAGGTPVRVATPVPAAPLAKRRQAFGTPQAVARVEESWRIVDEWWREQGIARTYHRVTLADGRILTLFQDDLTPSDGAGTAAWFVQGY